MSVLIAAEILAKAGTGANLLPEIVDVPELGGSVAVRRLTAGGLDDYQAAIDEADDENVRAVILTHAIGDDAGRRIFASAQAKELSGLPAPVATRVIRAFNRINGLVAEEVQKK